MSRYRRRQQTYLDGSVSGVELNRLRPGIKAFSTHSGVGQRHAHVEEYDPRQAAYDSNAPEYSPPDPWFEGMTHQASPRERIAPSWPPPPTVQHEPAEYQDSRMTPALFLRALEDISTDGALQDATEASQHEIMLPAEETCAQSPQLEQSMWAPREMRGEHPWFNSSQAPADMYERMMVQATEQQDRLAEMASQEAGIQAMCDQQPPGGLEAVIDSAMPPQAQDDPFEMERRMQDQQRQQMEQLLNPFMMPSFGPGP